MTHYRLHPDPKSSQRQVARFVQRAHRSPILDVGAAQGLLGQLLHGQNLIIDAVEPHPQWAEAARPFYRSVFATGIEAAPLPDNTYRLVVCADVLEHTVDPVAVLRRLRRAATQDALFIISLPNVAHFAVRLMLLAGKFPRMERGILDRTHLHFYTRDTIVEMLREAGLQPMQSSVTGVPLDELWKSGQGTPVFKILMRAQHGLLNLAPRVFGFQWIFVARAAKNTAESES